MMNREENRIGFEIDYVRLLLALWKFAALILIVGILFSAAFLLYAYTYVTPMYQASALYYANNRTISLSSSLTVNTLDMGTASSLIGTYIEILKTRSNLELILAESGAPYSYEKLRGMISYKVVNTSGLFNVTVTSSSPEEARVLANVIADVLPARVSDIVSGSTIEVVDYAVTPRSRVSPNYFSYAAKGMLIGMALVAALVLFVELRDDVIHDEDFLLENYSAPLLATIPNLNSRQSKKYGSYGSYGDYSSAAEKGKTS